MIGSLKCSYPGLTSETMTDIMDNIQKSIRQKVSNPKLVQLSSPTSNNIDRTFSLGNKQLVVNYPQGVFKNIRTFFEYK